jgi:uncharacterized membrane protein (DUF4010 family)
MEQQELITGFLMFGTAGLLGFLIGLERSMGESENPHATIRDFVIFALIGATSAFAGVQYDNAWLIVGGFIGVLTLLISGYWAQHRRKEDADPGITTEAAAVVTFFLGVLIIKGATELAIAVAIVLLVILSEKRVIDRFGTQIQNFELQATLKFLVITFIVLPILPHQSLDNFVTFPIGTVTEVDATAKDIDFEPAEEQAFEKGARLHVYSEGTGEIGTFEITEATDDAVSAEFIGEHEAFETITPGTELRMPFVPNLISTMLSALKPFQVWLIVVLVSFIGFVGYVLIKVVGAGAGIGLTGLIGGLASSTVTTLSFSGRSRELPQLNRIFAVAVILASSVMFPRVLLQIGVFNQPLMANIALPMLITGGTGLVLATFLYVRSKESAVESEEISFDNPFSLKSAVTFGLIFATILVVTRVATAYLGEAWLPVVAIVSGLTDADAIAFSVSDLQRAGLISLDWASFNLVLGSLSNTYMKLFLVFSLGHRGLFKHCLISFLIMGAAGIVTMLLYYDIWDAVT